MCTPRPDPGVCVQAVAREGALVDGVRRVEAERMVYRLNASSPGATVSISLGKTMAEMATKHGAWS
jgi:L-2-hydroxyglutarate oxidase